LERRSERRFSLYRLLSKWARLPIAGPIFRWYAPRRTWPQEEERPGRLRIVIVNLLPSLGDTICYMPVADALRSQFPEAEITYIGDRSLTGLIAHHSSIDHVWPVSIPAGLLNRLPTVKMYYRLFHIARSVRSLELPHRFEVAILPRGGTDPSFSAHLVWMLNARRSIGFTRLVEPVDTDHNFGDCLITELRMNLGNFHESERGLDLLESSGLVADASQKWNSRMPIRSLQEIADDMDAGAILQKVGLDEAQSFVVMAPGASSPHKTWPSWKFRALCELILRNTDFTVVLTGSPSETAVASAVAQGLGKRVVNGAGKLNLLELIGLLRKAIAFVGNDSGPGHIAGSLGIPTISLHVQPRNSDPLHIKAPAHHRPAGPHVTVVQPERFLAPCLDRCEANTVHCLDQVTVEEVWMALAHALGVTSSDAAGEPSNSLGFADNGSS
jgi:ADP-heptose:LPS heptosyltransferase